MTDTVNRIAETENGMGVSIDFRDLAITAEQAELIGQLQMNVQIAQAQVNAALAAVIAGHGLSNAEPQQLNVKERKLTVIIR